jgi:hypothetical protein
MIKAGSEWNTDDTDLDGSTQIHQAASKKLLRVHLPDPFYPRSMAHDQT